MLFFLSRLNELAVYAVLDIGIGCIQSFFVNLLDDNVDRAISRAGRLQLILALLLISVDFLFLFFRYLFCYLLLNYGLNLHFLVLLAFLVHLLLLIAHLCYGLLLAILLSAIVFQVSLHLVASEGALLKHCHQFVNVGLRNALLLYCTK